MGAWRWIGIGGCALWIAAAAPAQAGKAIVVDYGAAVVYPVDDGALASGPLVTNNGRVLRGKYLGTFRISEKLRHKRSNMYNTHGDPLRPGQEGALMPYWMRLGSTAQGFHHSTMFANEGPRHRSRGCYRLSKKNAAWLFGWAPVGTTVYVLRTIRDSRFAWLGGTSVVGRVSAGAVASSHVPRSSAAIPVPDPAAGPTRRSRPRVRASVA